jgi:hypothetical protein
MNDEIKFHDYGPSGGILNEGFDNNPQAGVEPEKVSLYYTVTLTHVLDRLKAPNTIDYLCLDIEGKKRCLECRCNSECIRVSRLKSIDTLQVQSFMHCVNLHLIGTLSKF